MTAIEIVFVALTVAVIGLVFSFVIGSREGTLRRYRRWGGTFVILMLILVLVAFYGTFTGRIR